MIDIDLEGRNPRELQRLKEDVMRSDLPINNKTYLIRKIESQMGMRYGREDVLLMIKESSADVDDIGE